MFCVSEWRYYVWIQDNVIEWFMKNYVAPFLRCTAYVFTTNAHRNGHDENRLKVLITFFCFMKRRISERYVHYVNYLNHYCIKYAAEYSIKIFVDVCWLNYSFVTWVLYYASLNFWILFFLHLVRERYKESSTEIKRKPVRRDSLSGAQT